MIAKSASSKLREYWEIATWAFLSLACAYSIALRAYLASRNPLWMDESWTAVLSVAPSLRSFTDQMRLDSNAPLYYFLMWLWPFESDFGLRLPSILFMSATAVCVVIWAPLDRDRRMFWAALLILWPEGISLFQDARYYGLLYFISTIQTIAYVALLRRPSTKRACLWTGLCTLAILTHYYAAILATFQGLFYLWLHRRRAIATWPALILTVPAFAWLAYHWPRLHLYAQAGISWYQTLEPIEGLKLLLFPWGGWWIGLVVLLFAWLLRRRRPISIPFAATGMIALATGTLMIGVGILAPVMTPRYLVPVIPPLLLCMAVSIKKFGFLPIAALIFLPASGLTAWTNLLDERANFGLERAAELTPANASVTWWIDYPGSKIHDGPQMRSMLADAFQRARIPLQKARWGTDFEAGNAAIIIHQSSEPRKASSPANWPCSQISDWSHSTRVCVRP